MNDIVKKPFDPAWFLETSSRNSAELKRDAAKVLLVGEGKRRSLANKAPVVP